MTKPAERRTLSLLFADTHGFSKLSDFQISQYVANVLPIIAQLLDTHKPVDANTWGDGLFVAFNDPSTAAKCALELRDKFLDGQWETMGLPNELAVRIALHAGALHIGADPVRKKLALFGPEVNRTARIEPIVAPTQIYATGAFRAMFPENDRFAFDPLGKRDLAKSWGRQELFGLRRAREPEIKAVEPSPPSPVLPTANSVMTLANEALARHPDQIRPLLTFVDTQNFQSRVVRRNWYINLEYDLSKLGEGVITEKIEWEYNLFNHSGAPVTYVAKFVEVEDMASHPDKRSFTKTPPAGDPESLFPPAARTQTKLLTRYDSEILVPPGDSDRIKLVYSQSWKVNPQAPAIHNCLVPRDPVLVCRIEVRLPEGYSIVLLVNNEEQTPEPGWNLVYRIPMLTASQAIEYVISGPKLLNEHSP